MEAFSFKFLLVGNAGVGKTSLVRRFCKGEFDQSLAPTVAVEFLTKIVEFDGTKLKLQIWDTAGQERYRSVGKAYYRSAVGVLCVFSLADHSTLDAVGDWLKEVRRYCHPQAKVVVVGNKVDLVEQRRVTSEEARGLAEREGCEYQETSAKEATNVDECFYQMARDVYRLVVTNELNLQEPTLDIGNDTEGGGATRRCC